MDPKIDLHYTVLGGRLRQRVGAYGRGVSQWERFEQCPICIEREYKKVCRVSEGTDGDREVSGAESVP